jgi:hypothetical protein
MWRLVKRSHERGGVDLGNDLGVSQRELAELRSLFFLVGKDQLPGSSYGSGLLY